MSVAIKNNLLEIAHFLGIYKSPFVAITTMHQKGYEEYGKNMLSYFDKFWPKNIELHVYLEDFQTSNEKYSRRIFFYNLHTEIPDLLKFKVRNKERQELLFEKLKQENTLPADMFKWEALRFSNKVFSIHHFFNQIKKQHTHHLIWLDADIMTFAPIPHAFFEEFTPPGYIVSYLGRQHMHSECGFMIFNLYNNQTANFLNTFVKYYKDDLLFDLKEFHDSFIFDEVIKKFQPFASSLINISTLGSDVSSTNHPFVNSKLGNYMDHIKGNRKDTGHSQFNDLKTSRSEHYWESLKRQRKNGKQGTNK